jgi:Flp pilus assembly protein TadD
MNLEEILEEGIAAVAMGEFDQAIELFKKATELNPQYFEAWHSLGMAYMKAQRYPEAVQAGIKAVELNPNDQFSRVSLSMYFQRNGQIPEAEAEAAKAKILSWGGKLLANIPGGKLPSSP